MILDGEHRLASSSVEEGVAQGCSLKIIILRG